MNDVLIDEWAKFRIKFLFWSIFFGDLKQSRYTETCDEWLTDFSFSAFE